MLIYVGFQSLVMGELVLRYHLKSCDLVCLYRLDWDGGGGCLYLPSAQLEHVISVVLRSVACVMLGNIYNWAMSLSRSSGA